jgi:hypothetical protein
MNPVEKTVRRIDAVQQQHKVPTFVVALIKKYGDDNGGVLVANLAHSGFVSLFPLLLVLVTLLGLVASNDPAVRYQVLGAVLGLGVVVTTLLTAWACAVTAQGCLTSPVRSSSPPPTSGCSSSPSGSLLLVPGAATGGLAWTGAAGAGDGCRGSFPAH